MFPVRTWTIAAWYRRHLCFQFVLGPQRCGIANISCQIGLRRPYGGSRGRMRVSVGLERESIMPDSYSGPQDRPGAVSPIILLPVRLA